MVGKDKKILILGCKYKFYSIHRKIMILFNVHEYFTYMYIYTHYMDLQCQQKPKQGMRTPGVGVSDGCQLPCGCRN